MTPKEALKTLEILSHEGHTVMIYEGTAPVIRDPKIITIKGNIDAPFRWLDRRRNNVNFLDAHLIIDREKMTITLNLGDKDYFGDTIQGKAQEHPKFAEFGINKDKYRTPAELATFIKMNRSFFENQSTAMSLVDTLFNFRAKVDKDIERIQDTRGNKRDLTAQVVNSNLPEKFNIEVPIFKGFPKQTIEVEVFIKPEDLTCCLISPMANDIVEQMRDNIIDAELGKIEEITSAIATIEV